MLDWDELEQAEDKRKQDDISVDTFPGVEIRGVTDIVVPRGRSLRVYLISDVHVDYAANKQWLVGCLEQLDRECFNCLVLPGDVCDGEARLDDTLRIVADAFAVVCYCFGNHEAWVRGERNGDSPAKTSLEKLGRVHRICRASGVHVGPVRLVREDSGERLLLLPLWSWYHSSWDCEPDLPEAMRPPVDPADRVADYRLCRWTELEEMQEFVFGGNRTSEVLAEFFATHNEAHIEEALSLLAKDGGELLTFSHFCPRIELILEKRHLFDQHVAQVSGSQVLERQIRRLQPVCHAFGHTHVPWDVVIDGIRYVQWGLGNVKERKGQSMSVSQGGLLLLHDDGHWAPVQFTHWGCFHADPAARAPGSADLAPWVSAGYAQLYPQMAAELQRRGLLVAPDRDGFAAYFPGGAGNNNLAYWARHRTEGARWRCPPEHREEQEFPCGAAGCLCCAFNAAQAARPSAWWAGRPRPALDAPPAG